MASGTPFLKMHGLGNDFVVLDARRAAFDLTPARRRAIADRRLGVGCDQLIVLEPPTESDADVAALLADPNIAALRATKQNKNVFTTKELAGAMAFSSALSLPVVTQQLPPLLAKALA